MKRLGMILLLGDYVFGRPFLSCAISFSLGIICAYYMTSSYILVFILSLIVLIIAAFILLEQHRVILWVLVIFFGGFSLMSWQDHMYRSSYSVDNYNGLKQVKVVGQVKEDLSSLQGNKIYIRPYNIAGNTVKYGLIQLDKRYIPLKLNNGDIVRLNLSLRQADKQMNPGGFSSIKFLKRKGVYSKGYYNNGIEVVGEFKDVFINPIINIKYQLMSLLDRTVEAPYNELFKALLLGERERLPEEWREAFTNAGVNHLLAISGLHVGFIVLIFLNFLMSLKLPEGLRDLVLTLILIIYIILTGFRASVFRASILSVAFIWAPYFKRRGDILNVIGLTAFLNLVLDPYQLFSIGFQLSYFVLLMIILWYRILEKYITAIFSVSAAALIGSSPLTAYYFNMVSPIALISNIWAIPLVGLLISISLVALFLGLIHPILSIIIFKILIYPTKLLLYGTRIMSAIPLASIEVATPSIYTMGFIIILLLVLPFLLKKKIIPFNERIRQRRLYYLVIISVIFLFINFTIPIFNNSLEISFISVGQGDSILLRSPDNHYIMVDGGGYLGTESTQGEYTILPYLKHRGIKKLDIVFITHFDADHAVGFLDILGNRKVGLLVLPYNFERNEVAAKIIEKAEENNVAIVLIGDGDYFNLGDVRLDILNPDYKLKAISRNENSLVIRLVYRKFSLLLTGDLEEKGEKRLLRKDYFLKSDILKLGHHGSNSSTSEQFLKQVSPRHGIISVGRNNYGHPSDDVLFRTKRERVKIWRTDIHGEINIKTNGIQYKIRSHLNAVDTNVNE